MKRKPIHLFGLANDSNSAATQLLGMANEFGDKPDEWMQLTPFGDFPHKEGIQRIDAVAAKGMANNFNSLRGKVGRWLGKDVPVYIGHPDVDRAKYPDAKAYGWLEALEARADGLYGKLLFNEEGGRLVSQKHFRFQSPYWLCATIGSAGGRTIFRPAQLVSIGLTNEPNLPVRALANEQGAQTEMNAELLTLLGLANEASGEQIQTRVKALLAAEQQLNAEKTARTEAETALANERTALANERGTLTTERGIIAALRKDRANATAGLAVAEGRIAFSEMPAWEARLLANDASFAAEKASLLSIKPKLPTTSQLAGAGSRQAGASPAGENERRAKLTGLVNEKMKGRTAAEYPRIFNQTLEQHPELAPLAK